MNNPHQQSCHLSLLLFLACLPATGCSSNNQNRSLPLGPANAIQYGPADGFNYIEFPRSDSGTTRPVGITSADRVDYKSTIRLDPDKSKLASVTLSKPLLVPLSADNQRRLEDLPKLLSTARDYLAAATKVNQMAASDLAVPNGKLNAATVTAVKQLALQGEALENLVIEVAERRVAFEHPAYNQNQRDTEVGNLTNPLFVDSNDKPVRLNLDRFGQFISDEVNWANQVIAKNRDAALATAQRISVTAELLSPFKKPVPVRIQNYYDAAISTTTKQARLTFSMSDDDQKQLQQGEAIASEAANFINEARDKSTPLGASLRQLASAQGLNEELKALTDQLKVIAPVFSDGNKTTIIQTAITAAKTAATAEQQTQLTALNTSLGALPSKIANVQAGLENLPKLKASAGNTGQLTSTLQSLTGITSDVRSLVTEIRADLPYIKTLMDILGGAAPAAANLAAVKNILTDQVLANLTAIGKSTLSGYPHLADAIAAAISGTSGNPLTFTGDAQVPSSLLHKLAIDELVQGSINLDLTPAEEGDTLVITVTAEPNDPNKGVSPVSSSVSFDVSKFGLVNTWSANLVFVRRASGPNSSNFVAAPSVSWNLHYRPRPSGDTDYLAKVWSGIDPGVGINVDGLNFDNSGVQVGIGGHLSLLHDLIAIGGGYNLNASHDRYYIFVGIGVFQTLQQAGRLLNPGGR